MVKKWGWMMVEVMEGGSGKANCFFWIKKRRGGRRRAPIVSDLSASWVKKKKRLMKNES